MRKVEVNLELSRQPWGYVLTGRVDFEEDVRLLLFAWSGQDLSWVKAPRRHTGAALDICYHPCTEGRVQLLARVAHGVSTNLMLKADQTPTTGMKCWAELSVPSVLYSTRDHGLGLLAVPTALTQSRRKGLWHLKPQAVTPDLAFFEQAYGRHGAFVGHPFASQEG